MCAGSFTNLNAFQNLQSPGICSCYGQNQLFLHRCGVINFQNTSRLVILLQRWAYFSKKLHLQNYVIGNQDLLAVKLALEEWWHCLEGAVHLERTIRTSSTFMRPKVWTLVNSGIVVHQIQLPQYHPSSKNGKVDDLSRIHFLNDLTDPEHYQCIISPI